MYKVYCDEYLLHDDAVQTLRLTEPELKLEVNKAGKFTFQIYPDHQHYKKPQRFKSTVTIYQDDYMIFRGRILNDNLGFYNEREIECEGELAFLLDSIQRPYDYTGDIAGFLSLILQRHNEQVEMDRRLLPGNVTVTDSNDYIHRSGTTYPTTWKVLEEGLLDTLGGYLWVRHETDGNYLDYLADFDLTSVQEVTFGKNLLDMLVETNGEDTATVLVPLGAKLKDEDGRDTDARLTIASVNDGLDYIEDTDAVLKYGRITKTEIWDDVTVAGNLLLKARAALGKKKAVLETVELSAADLAAAGENVASFRLGRYVRVYSEPHSMDQKFLVSKLELNLADPTKSELTLGKTVLTYTERQAKQNASTVNKIEIVEKQEGPAGKDGKDAAIQSDTEPEDTSMMWLDTSQTPPLLKQWNGEAWVVVGQDFSDEIAVVSRKADTSIQQAEASIMSAVSEQYYRKGAEDDPIAVMENRLTQTADGLLMQIKSVQTCVDHTDETAANADKKVNEILNYLNYEVGTDGIGVVTIGTSASNVKLKQRNDRVYFEADGAEVAYISDKKLYILDGEFLGALKIGSLALIRHPADNGIVVKKVVG